MSILDTLELEDEDNEEEEEEEEGFSPSSVPFYVDRVLQAQEKANLEDMGDDPPSGLGAAFSMGVDQIGLATANVEEMLAETLDDYDATKGIATLLAQDAEIRREENLAQIADMAQYRTAREDMGIGSLDEVLSGVSYYGETIAQSTPLLLSGIAATVGAAKLGLYLGLGATATAIAAGTAGTLSRVPFFTGTNIERQKEEGAETTDDLDYSDALVAAGFQSVIDQAVTALGLKLFSRIGKPASDNFLQTANQAKKDLGKRIVKGGAVTGVAGGISEGLQQVAEQVQAGLDPLAPEQLDESYKATIDGFVAEAVIGAGLSAAGVDVGASIDKQKTEDAIVQRFMDMDLKMNEEVRQEIETKGDISTSKVQQINREILAEEYYEQAKIYYDAEVEAGRDPEEVKGEIALELEKTLLIDQDRAPPPIKVGPVDESSSIQQKATESVGTFLDSLGTDKVDTSRPDLSPDLEPKEVTPPAEAEAGVTPPTEVEDTTLTEGQERIRRNLPTAVEQEVLDEYERDIRDNKITIEEAKAELKDLGYDPNLLFPQYTAPKSPEKPEATQFTDEYIDELVKAFEQRKQQDIEQGRKPDDLTSDALRASLKERQAEQQRRQAGQEEVDSLETFREKARTDVGTGVFTNTQEATLKSLKGNEEAGSVPEGAADAYEEAGREQAQKNVKDREEAKPDGDTSEFKSTGLQILNDLPEDSLDPKVRKAIGDREIQLSEEREMIFEEVLGDESQDAFEYEPKPINDFLNVIADDTSGVTTEGNKELAKTLSNRLSVLEAEGAPSVTAVVGDKDVYQFQVAPTATAARNYSDAMGGSFIPSRGVIFLNREERSEGVTHEVILHESVHAATAGAVNLGRMDKYKDTELGKTVSELQDVQGIITEHIKNRLKPFDKYIKMNKDTGQTYYDKNALEADNMFESKEYEDLTQTERAILDNSNRFANEDETLAWALTNPDAKVYLEGIKIPKDSPLSNRGKNKTLWQAFVDWVKRLLKISPKEETALEKVLDISDRILSADPKVVAEMGRELKKAAEDLAAKDKPVEFKSLRSIFGFLSTKTKADTKPATKPKTTRKPRAKTTTKKVAEQKLQKELADLEQKQTETALSKRAVRKKYVKASDRAMAEKIVSVVDKNVQEDLEAANVVVDKFRPNEDETKSFMSPAEIGKVNNLLNTAERDLLEGKNKNIKTPASAAWNYFKGYKKPESALRALAYDIGVGVVTGEKSYNILGLTLGETRPAFTRDTKKVLLSMPELDFLSPWEQAFFTGTGGDNALLFVEWAEANLSKNTLVNIRNLAEVYRRKNEALSKFTSDMQIADLVDPKDPAQEPLPFKVLEPGSQEFKDAAANINWDKREKTITDAEIESARKKRRERGVVKAVKKDIAVKRNAELAYIKSLEDQQIQSELDTGKITAKEAATRRAIAEIKYEGLKAEYKLKRLDDQVQQDVKNIISGHEDSVPLTIEAARELDALFDTRLVGAVNTRNKTNSAMNAALEYLFNTTKNVHIRKTVQTFYKHIADKQTKLELTVKDLTDANGNVIASQYDPTNNLITINVEYFNARALLHEIAHALTVGKIKSAKLPAVKELKAIYKEAKVYLGDVYGASGGFEEFIAEAFSNVRFRKRLAGTNPDGKRANLLQRFMNAIRRLLNAIFGTKFKTNGLDQVDQLLNELVTPVTDIDSMLNGATAANVVERVLSVSETYRKKREKIANSEPVKLNKLREFLSYNSQIQRAFNFIASNQGVADMGSRLGLKNLDVMEELQQRLKGAVDGVDKEIESLVTFYDLLATKGGPEFVETFNDIVYDDGYGATINQVDPRANRSQAIAKYGQNSNKFAIWEAQRDAWNKLGSISVQGKTGQDLFNEINVYYVKQFAQLRSILLNRVEEVLRAGEFADLSDTRIKAKLNKIDGEVFAPLFDKQPLEVYFPLTRQGTFGVSFKLYPDAEIAEQNPRSASSFQLYATRADARERIDGIRERAKEAEEVNKKIQSYRNLPPEEQAKKIEALLPTQEAREQHSWFEAVDLNTLSKVPIDITKDRDDPVTLKADKVLVQEIFKQIEAQSGNIDADTLSNLQQGFTDLLVKMLPETSFAKQLQTRTATPGYIADVLFGLQTKGRALGRSVARYKVAPDIDTAIEEINKQKRPDFSGIDRMNRLLINENPDNAQDAFETMKASVLLRLREMKNPSPITKLEKTSGYANRIAFLYTIGFNPSAALVNLSQIPMVTQPMLMGEYGSVDASVAGRLAFRYLNVSPSGFSVGLQNWYDYNAKTETFTVKSDAPVEYKNDLEKLKPLVSMLRKRGLLSQDALDQQFARDRENEVPFRESGDFDRVVGEGKTRKAVPRITGIGSADKVLDALDTGTQKLTTLSGVMFSGAEKMSRQYALIATYLLEIDRLAKIKSRKGEKVNATDTKNAVDKAIYVMQETNGPSFRESAAPITKYGALTMTMMFKAFGFQMIYLQLKQSMRVINSLFKSRAGATQAEVDEIRRQRKAAITFMLASTGVGIYLSGLLGHPLYSIYETVYNLYQRIADEFSDDEPELKTAEETLRKTTRETLDKLGLAEIINPDALHRGYLMEHTGLNAGDRMRLSGLLLPEDKFKRELSLEEEAFTLLGGPAYSTFKKLQRSKKNFDDGLLLRGFEEALPVGISNVLKAGGRYRDEGVRTRDNQIILEDMTTPELLSQAFGFRTKRLVRRQEFTGSGKFVESKVATERQTLLDLYSLQTFRDEPKELEKVMKNINRFNKRYATGPDALFPELFISKATVSRSIKTQKRMREDAIYGVKYGKAFEKYIEENLEIERRLEDKKREDTRKERRQEAID